MAACLVVVHTFVNVCRAPQIRTQFWASHQRFFRQVLMACKVPRCAALARDKVRQGMCCVIGLQSTGAPLRQLHSSGISTFTALFVATFRMACAA